jgi:large subunit ribosomal protein L25
MENLKLQSEKREKIGKKNKTLKGQGLVPAVLYGKDVKSENLKVDRKEFDRVYKEAGESALLDLSVGSDVRKVLISEVQVDPVTGDYLHIDFHQVNLREKVSTEVPLEFLHEEEAPAIKELEGTLVKEKHEIEVECLPTEIPHEITVDLMVLKTFEDVIRVSDIKVPENVEILNDPEEVIALAKPPRSEEELEALEEDVVEDVEKVEVEGVPEEAEGEAKEESQDVKAAE